MASWSIASISIHGVNRYMASIMWMISTLTRTSQLTDYRADYSMCLSISALTRLEKHRVARYRWLTHSPPIIRWWRSPWGSHSCWHILKWIVLDVRYHSSWWSRTTRQYHQCTATASTTHRYITRWGPLTTMRNSPFPTVHMGMGTSSTSKPTGLPHV